MIGLGVLVAALAAFSACVNIKSEIIKEQEMIISSSGDISEHKNKLAVLYFNDQELEKAFDSYIEALQTAIIQPHKQVSAEEMELYKEALNIYLDSSNDRKSKEAATLIKRKYSPVISIHQDYHLLSFILAAAYANLEEFPKFFELFYESYRFFPDHYLAYKGKAAIHARLFALRRTGSERDKESNHVTENLIQAIKYNPNDITLYRMLFAFTQEDKKGDLVNTYLNIIINENIIIPRMDIEFFVNLAITTKQHELAKKFLCKCLLWYPQSRSIRKLINETAS